uniref:Uncharacterized protein n=1 Tax=Romanomermis culicivorax TaxID=13658 RepID=A0A915J6Q5_ROMCU
FFAKNTDLKNAGKGIFSTFLSWISGLILHSIESLPYTDKKYRNVVGQKPHSTVGYTPRGIHLN